MKKTETVKLHNGEERDIEIRHIGSRKADMILDEHLKVNGIKTTDDGRYMDISGTSLFQIKSSFLDFGLVDFDYDELAPGESNRIFQKYYEKTMTDAMNFVGGNPQS